MNFLLKAAIAVAAAAATCAFADVSVTTGAGYAKMVQELAATYKAQGNAPVAEVYGGNIGQMMAQIPAGSGVNVVITDLGTLKRIKTSVEFSKTLPLGETPLVFIWRKGLNLAGPADIASDAVKSFAFPDPKAAIYGRAAKAWLESSGLSGKLASKTMQVAAVPQVMAYVAKGEVDAGFVNRSAARNGAAKIGGSVEVTSGYPKIAMAALVVKGAEKDPQVAKFLGFLGTDAARAVLAKHGVR